MTEIEIPEFRAWPKIARLNRDIIITEKIDGTNSAVIVTEDGRAFAQSRTRIITPGKKTDNFGFAAWVEAYAPELIEVLGVGYHYGEWWGSGIQRGYGYQKGERFFSLFNVHRWRDVTTDYGMACVPVLYEGPFNPFTIDRYLNELRSKGTKLRHGHPGGPAPDAEGIVIYHTAAGQLFKVTLENDEVPKKFVVAA